MSLSIVFERMLGNTKAYFPAENGIICCNIASTVSDKGMRLRTAVQKFATEVAG